MATPAPLQYEAPPGAHTVRRILRVAGALFAEHGYDAASMSAIADRASVSKANLFHHFGSKEKLYLAVLDTINREATLRLDTLEHSSDPLPARLERFATGHLRSLLEHEHITRLILRELIFSGSRQGRTLIRRIFGEKFSRLVAILRAAQAEGELNREFDPALAATMLLGANVFFYESRELLRRFPDVTFANDPDRYARDIVALLLNGIARHRARHRKKQRG